MEACPLCGLRGRLLSDVLRRGSGMVFLCESCDHGFLVSDETTDARSFYSGVYRTAYSHEAHGSATNTREIFDVYEPFQDDRLGIMAENLNGSVRLLEVRASSGQFLSRVRSLVGTVDAIELDGSCCDFMRTELDIAAESSFLSESRYANGGFDIVCAFQVLEHVEDPVGFLSDLRAALHPGGRVYVEVPNLHDPLISVRGVKVYHGFYYHGAHLHYFSEQSLRATALVARFDGDTLKIVFTQDCNLLNHLHWITMGGSQDTGQVGLSPIDLRGTDHELAGWSTEAVREQDDEYRRRLVESGRTSNLMLMAGHGS